ncbi:MAG6450 family protein [Pediococcus sp. M21F004]|uniref:MAG6450 family protein n=1 Tax=Pediococcus sp. M21F004 TaxID=3390033 RepID=UPI003DA73BD9
MVIKMSHKLTAYNSTTSKVSELTLPKSAKAKAMPLTSDKRSSVKFKLVIDHTLENGYTFKKLSPAGLKNFSKFLIDTVGKGLSITETEKLYLRTDGPNGAKNEEKINSVLRTTYHFGNGGHNEFRIHGYYENDCFVVHRIDPKHKFRFDN